MRLIVSICTLIASLAHAEVREAAHLADLASEITPGTLLVFDIDNTMLKTRQMLGSSQWLDYYAEERIKSGLSRDKAYEQAVVIWAKVQAVSEVEPVETDTVDFIRQRQSQGIQTMVLSARRPEMRERTFRQFKRVGLDFSRHAVHRDDFRINGERPGLYSKGVVFANGVDKGKTLARFLKKTGLKPKRIVFFDDQKNNIEDMEAAFKDSPIPHISVRYAAADGDVRNFVPAVANVELEHFGKPLSDSAARAIIQCGGGPPSGSK